MNEIQFFGLTFSSHIFSMKSTVMSFLHFQVLCQPNALFAGDCAAHILQTWDVSDNQCSWASFCISAVHQCSVDIDGADISVSLQTF